MRTKGYFFIHCFWLGLLICSVNSCVLFKPLPLDPLSPNALQNSLGTEVLSQLNGRYKLKSVKRSGVYLDVVLLQKKWVDHERDSSIDADMALQVVDANHIKVALYKNGQIARSKTIKGVFNNGYFHFHSTHLSWKYAFWIYSQQTSRITVTKDHQLLLDNNHGGIGFFLILPIPLSGASMDQYDLVYERIR